MIHHHHVESSALDDDSVRPRLVLISCRLAASAQSTTSKSRAEKLFLKDPEQTRFFYDRLIVRH